MVGGAGERFSKKDKVEEERDFCEVIINRFGDNCDNMWNYVG